jgi:transcriptional regulator GlxA family with amidase domain
MGHRPTHVSILVFPECDPSIIYGMHDTLWFAGIEWVNGVTSGQHLFESRIVTAEPGAIRLCTGVSIVSQATIDEVASTDVVFIPNVIINSADGLRNLDRRMLDWLVRMHAQGAQIYAACGGSLVLAEAGLLDGQEATTHWCYVPLFREEFPNVKLHEDRILVQTGQGRTILCCGGASSWQDLALLLIAKHGGTDEAIRISKFFLYQWHREGQLPFASMIASKAHGDAAIERAQSWVAQNYERPDIVAELVQRSGLPKRTFDRRFRAATGYSPLAYVQALRIEEAKHLLETGNLPIEEIAREVGYSDLASFRRLFRRRAGMSPGDYRRKLQLPDFVRQLAAQRPVARAGTTAARSGTASAADTSRRAAAPRLRSAGG